MSGLTAGSRPGIRGWAGRVLDEVLPGLETRRISAYPYPARLCPPRGHPLRFPRQALRTRRSRRLSARSQTASRLHLRPDHQRRRRTGVRDKTATPRPDSPLVPRCADSREEAHAITEFEQELGARLFYRTTRHLSLTAERRTSRDSSLGLNSRGSHPGRPPRDILGNEGLELRCRHRVHHSQVHHSQSPCRAGSIRPRVAAGCDTQRKPAAPCAAARASSRATAS